LQTCRCRLPCVKGVAPAWGRANRIFVLVGPPAEERRVPNNEPPIRCDEIGSPAVAAALWPLPGGVSAPKGRTAPVVLPGRCERLDRAISGDSWATQRSFDSPNPQRPWPRHSARATRSREPHRDRGNAKSSHSGADFSVTVVDEGPRGTRSTLARSGPRSNNRDE
jgi:hypothetical protein